MLNLVKIVTITDLAEIEQILEDGNLPEQEAVRDGVTHEEGRHQVLDRPGLAAVRPEGEGVEAAGLPQLVEDRDVGEHVIQVIRVRGVLPTLPLNNH